MRVSRVRMHPALSIVSKQLSDDRNCVPMKPSPRPGWTCNVRMLDIMSKLGYFPIEVYLSRKSSNNSEATEPAHGRQKVAGAL